MKKRNRLRDTRPKAFFGAIASLVGSAVNAYTNYKTSQMQAEAIRESARSAAASAEAERKLQIDLNNQQMNLLKSNFDRQYALQQQANMNSVLRGAIESENRMRRNAAPQVRNGGSITPKRRRLRSSYRQNIPGITFPDNGGAEVLGYTPDGIVAILRGPNHSNGGVDVDANGKKGVEAEGGELMKVEYQNGGNINNIKFISKHDLPGSGFNPAEAVLAGMMSPDEAYAAQEYIKDVNGISDDGRAKYGTKSPLRRMRCGGRRKAGLGILWNGLNNVERGNVSGALSTFAGNFLATGINALSNWRNARRVADAQQYAAGLMSDTYRNLPVIDANFMDNVRHANAVAVTQTPNYIDRYSRTANERSLQRGLRDIDRNSLSSAAASNRRARAEINAADAVTKIAENEARVNQGIIQNNLGIINDTIQKNAASQNQFNTQLAAIKADLLSERVRQQRENFIGSSTSDAEGKINVAQILAGANQQNWANLAGTIASGANGIGNALATNAKMRFDIENALLGTTHDNMYLWYMTHPNWQGYDTFMDLYKDTPIEGRENWYSNLRRNKYGIGYNRLINPLIPKTMYLG